MLCLVSMLKAFDMDTEGKNLKKVANTEIYSALLMMYLARGR